MQTSTGRYPYYSALWHLKSINVIEDFETYNSEPWSLAEQRQLSGQPMTRVALIDNSVAWEHPNLTDCINSDLMIDFVSARLGAFPNRSITEQNNAVPLPGRSAAEALATSLGPEQSQLLSTLIQRLTKPTERQLRVLPATHSAFSAHGTAMAGLIGARPAWAKPEAVPPTEVVGDIPAAVRTELDRIPTVLPYAGVDPFCEIVPISTGFDPDPEQFILALLYAVLIKSDVIVLARDFPDPQRSAISSKHSIPAQKEQSQLDQASRVAVDPATTERWTQLNNLLQKLSIDCPIACAAGNGADNRKIYPASIASPSNGIISVGAVTAQGTVSAFSSVSDTAGNIFAPSGDSERLDQQVQRLDTISTNFEKNLHSDDYLPNEVSDRAKHGDTHQFTVQELVSTDVPGKYGYNGSEFEADYADESPDLGSYYCRFSGTSGAVAVAGGFISLMISSGVLTRQDNKGFGLEVKRTLEEAAAPLPGTNRGNPAKQGKPVSAIRWSNLNRGKISS